MDVHVRCADGRLLAATHYGPERARLAIVVAGATGVPRGFYARFAADLAARGHAVLCFDYRGIGGSRQGPLRRDPARMEDWGRLDVDAAVGWMEAQHAGARLAVVAHSVGGQLFALASRARHVETAVFVACQTGHWRHWKGRRRAAVWLLWHAIIPALTRTLGRFPAPWFGMGEPLPPGVARQWARWARHRDYLVDDDGSPFPEHARWHGRALAIMPTDDPMFGPWSAQRALLDRHAAARILPVPAQGLGHFDFFTRPAWWGPVAAWLAAAQDHASLPTFVPPGAGDAAAREGKAQEAHVS